MTNEIEIPDSERWLSVLAGGMLVLSSLRNRDVWSGILLSLGGSALISRGLLGHDGWLEAIRPWSAGEAVLGTESDPEV